MKLQIVFQIALSVFVLSIISCGSYYKDLEKQDAISRASREFSCNPHEVYVQNLSGRIYNIDACGHRARYFCSGNGECIRED